MAKSKDKRINRLRALRRKETRIIGRARKRREKEPTSKNLQVIRRHRKVKSALLRKIRHRRRVLSLRGKSNGLTWYDGYQVSSWIVAYLESARTLKFWKGYVTSGHRSLKKQASLYYGAPGNGLIRDVTVAKPGVSNHNWIDFPRGAVDVSDWDGLIRYLHAKQVTRLKSYKEVIGNRDLVHFSHTGH